METIVFDTETTGLLKPSSNELADQPYIIEICCFRLDADNNIIDVFDTLVKPPVPISDEITKITGIAESDLFGKPTFVEIIPQLQKFFLGVERMVAHNLPFDRSMLANELARSGNVLKFPWPIDHVCTVERSMNMEQRRLRLSRLYELLFDREMGEAHRAKIDVQNLTECYVEMCKRGLI